MILKQEQYYINYLNPEYNINPIADPRLNSKHSKETKVTLSEVNKGENNPFYGQTYTPKTKAKIREVYKIKKKFDPF